MVAIAAIAPIAPIASESTSVAAGGDNLQQLEWLQIASMSVLAAMSSIDDGLSTGTAPDLHTSNGTLVFVSVLAVSMIARFTPEFHQCQRWPKGMPFMPEGPNRHSVTY